MAKLTAGTLARRLIYAASGGALVLFAVRRVAARRPKKGRVISIRTSLHLARSPDDVYRAWRDLTRLPRVLRHVDDVADLGDGRFHWKAHLAGANADALEWDAAITEDRPGEQLSWRSIPAPELRASGTLRFEAVPGGTVLHVELGYEPAAGRFDRSLVAAAKDDLRRFKAELETGEAPTVQGQSVGAGRRGLLLDDPARRGGDA